MREARVPVERLRGSWVSVLALGVLGCGGGGSGAAGPAVNAPVIANPVLAAVPGTCTVPGIGPGAPMLLTFDYTDADGDLRGGTFEGTVSDPAAGTLAFSVPIPPAGSGVTGTTAGQVTVSQCVRFGTSTSVQETVVVTDAAGHRSNTLTFPVPRPVGAPERPRA
jgi:hypothetical protein